MTETAETETAETAETLHGPGCSCEECWWTRGCHEACSCCGIPVEETES